MKNRKLVTLFYITLILILNGCYTQFSILEPKINNPATIQKIEIDTTSDSTIVKTITKIEQNTDTIYTTNSDNSNEREVCQWYRTFFGDYELRCYKTNYSNSWINYHNRPWWDYSSNYVNGYYNTHYPYNSYYNSSFEYYWPYSQNHYINDYYLYPNQTLKIEPSNNTVNTSTTQSLQYKPKRISLRPTNSVSNSRNTAINKPIMSSIYPKKASTEQSNSLNSTINKTKQSNSIVPKNTAEEKKGEMIWTPKRQKLRR